MEYNKKIKKRALKSFPLCSSSFYLYYIQELKNIILLSTYLILFLLAAARCMNYYGNKVDADNLLVLLGKSSLQSMNGAERAVKVIRLCLLHRIAKIASQ